MKELILAPNEVTSSDGAGPLRLALLFCGAPPLSVFVNLLEKR